MGHKRLTPEVRRQMHKEQFERVGHPGLAHVIERNIHTIAEMRERAHRSRSLQDRLADAITAFSGSMTFVWLHVLWFAAWVVINLGLTGLPAFDPFPFGLLTMIVSLEAIFLSTFILITQNRQAALADQREDLDLQIDLLSEYEVTRLLMLVDAIGKKLGIASSQDPELPELEQDVAPDVLLEKLKKENGAAGSRSFSE